MGRFLFMNIICSEYFQLLFTAVIFRFIKLSEIHQSLLHSTDTKVTICKHQMDSFWFGLVCYLYCTDGFNWVDTFKFLPVFDSHFRTGPALTPGAHRPIILNHWLWTTFGNVTNSFFFQNFSFNLFLTCTRTNTTLNEQCTNVIIIIILHLVTGSFIKTTCSHPCF